VFCTDVEAVDIIVCAAAAAAADAADGGGGGGGGGGMRRGDEEEGRGGGTRRDEEILIHTFSLHIFAPFRYTMQLPENIKSRRRYGAGTLLKEQSFNYQ
jgi:hypothetical protein